jgi:hypothetical protein
MDLEEQFRNPSLCVLCDPPKVNDAIAQRELYSGLMISPDGQWTIEGSANFLEFISTLFRNAVPAIGTFACAALGLTLFRGEVPAKMMVDVSALAGAGWVLLLTVTHAVAAVFLFRYVLDFLSLFKSVAAPTGRNPVFRIYVGIFQAFTWMLVVCWFGLPIIALAFLTGWLSLVWAAGHFVLAKRRERAWVFIEYGSTSTALLLFVMCFSAERLFPLGLIVIVMQSLLLTILDWKARERWLGSATTPTAPGRQ